MKKAAFLLVILGFLGCGNNPAPIPPPVPVPIPIPTPVPPVPPVPVPVTTFEVIGQKILIKAQMKDKSKAILEEMRGALRATVAQLEGVGIEKIKVLDVLAGAPKEPDTFAKPNLNQSY